MDKFQSDEDSVQSNDDFVKYLPGIYIESDISVTKNIFYFNLAHDSSIMRLHYHLNKTFAEEKYLDFPINIAHHFNHITRNNTGTLLSVFTPHKKQLINSSSTGNKAYLHNNMGCYIKINFPTILSIKELHPYIKVLGAQLVITPSPGAYKYPYQLPAVLNLYVTNEYNTLNSVISDLQSAVTGNLYIDELYCENTAYTYDILLSLMNY